MRDILALLQEQKRSGVKGNLYHWTQVNFAYNSNHMEGSRLSQEQTAQIFETNTLLAEGEGVKADDVVEMMNHFLLFDQMLEQAKEKLSLELIKSWHRLLKRGTSDERREWFVVGEWKKHPNIVGMRETSAPEAVEEEMQRLLAWYESKKEVGLEEIVEFHYRLESIHPFQDGNGRVGRMVMFGQCLNWGIMPVVILDQDKAFYYRGLREFEQEKGFLLDTCRHSQDVYEERVGYFLGGENGNKTS
jgi:Fic family protein